MSNTVNNNSEDINEIDMLKFIKNCLESVTIYESHKRITEYLYNFFVRQKENCEKQIGKVPKKQMSCFPISCMIELGVKIFVGMVVAQFVALMIFGSRTEGIEVLGNIIMLLIFLGMLILPFAIPIYKKIQEKKKIEQAYLQECEEQARLEKIANKKISILKENINIVTKVYKHCTERLKELYSYQFVYKKYQSLEACCTIMEYLESGRCDELNGTYGAYNKYDSEVASGNIIEHLSGDDLSDLDKGGELRNQLSKNQISLLEEANYIITWVKGITAEYDSLKFDELDETDISDVVKKSLLTQWADIVLEEMEEEENEINC